VFNVFLLIPVADNDGVVFTAEHHGIFEERALALFGGVSQVPALAAGHFLGAAARHYRDTLALYFVAVSSIVDAGRVGELAAFAKAHYRQESIGVAYLGLFEILG
jgi:hypothetical protein